MWLYDVYNCHRAVFDDNRFVYVGKYYNVGFENAINGQQEWTYLLVIDSIHLSCTCDRYIDYMSI